MESRLMKSGTIVLTVAYHTSGHITYVHERCQVAIDGNNCVKRLSGLSLFASRPINQSEQIILLFNLLLLTAFDTG
jgi:hypothetical protein